MNERIKWTAPKIKALKGVEKVATLTAYDFSTAHLLDEAGIRLVLVGDSLGMTMLGYENTLPVTMEDMLRHTAAVARGVKHALVVADMPFLSYQISTEQAIANAGRFIKEAHAGAVKIEGGVTRADLIRTLVANGIPVMGHIGLTPQNINVFGGYKIQGKKSDEASRVIEDAKAIDRAGVFSMVVEGVPAALAAEITAQVQAPTIGIGAGSGCDGQVLVVHDMLGLYDYLRPRYVKRYAELGTEMKKAFEQYKKEVEEGKFPGAEHSY